MSIARHSDSETAHILDVSAPPTNENSPHLVWVFAASLEERLDSATWLDTTRELRAIGWRVTLIGMGPEGKQQYRGVDALGIPRPDVYLLGQALYHINVVRYILSNWNDIDVVLFNQDSGIWLLPLRMLRVIRGQRRPQIVMDTRDVGDPKPGNLRVLFRNAFVNLNHWLAGRFADGQTTITPRFAELVDIPQQQLWGIWPSGVDPQPFTEAATMRQWPSADEPIRLVYIGVLLEKRHPLPLCQTVKKANERGMMFELNFYGDGPEADLVRRCAATSGGSVRVLPPIAHETVPQMLAQMHVGVTSLPEINDAKYAASSPVKLFEYMASGLPVLATANVCHTEVVNDGLYAFWVDETSVDGILKGLEQIWDQRDSLGTLGSEAQEAVNLWTWKAAASKLDQALTSGLSRNPAPIR